MPTSYLIIGVAVFIVLFIIFYIKAGKDIEAGKNSEEKQQIQKLIGQLAPEREEMTAAYGTWEFTKWQGKMKATTYWYYAVGFSDSMLIAVPLSFDGGEMSYGEPVTYHKEDIKIVNSDKNNLLPWVELYTDEDACVFSVMIQPDNTRDDRYHPVNIQQQEEKEKFIIWRDRWMREINEQNGIEVSGIQKNPLKKKKKK